MGDTAVDFFLETLKQLITGSKLHSILDKKHQLESLEEEIKYLRGFLKATEKIRKEYSELMELVMQIRSVVSEAENILDLFVIDSFKLDNPSLDLESVKKEIKDLTAEVKQIYDENMYDINGATVNKLKHSSIGSGGVESIATNKDYEWTVTGDSLDVVKIVTRMRKLCGYAEIISVSLVEKTKSERKMKKVVVQGSCPDERVRQKTMVALSSISGVCSISVKVVKELVVGFEEEVKRVIEKLDEGGQGKPLEIITIIGTGGGGKTTLAREVYHHPFTKHTFQIRAWVDVSQDYDNTMKRDLLICILKLVSPENHQDYEKRSEDKLGEDLHKCLKGRKYLIVMDDIWGIEAWNDMQRSFPRECKGSKVLFTSRLVVQPDSIGCVPHCLALLPKSWSWELLQKKVFGIKNCPLELVEIGKRIAEKCEGLPLAIVTVAGILATEDKTPNVWEEVAKHISSIIAKNQERCMEILELSYNHLPLHLKVCFIYIGAFPEDYEIHVRELMWFWIAEGFIQPSDHGGESLEAIANNYLIDLINRNLVMIARKRSLGEIKACRIHDLLRELCLKKAEEDNFLVKINEDDSLSPSATHKYRRLFIGCKFLPKFSFGPRAQNLHSFLCLCSRNCPCLPGERNMAFIFENFKLLRVLSFNPAECGGGEELAHLVHLRYLACTLRADHWRLAPINYPLNLEILDVQALQNSDHIELPLDIFKMVKLRHIYSRAGIFTYHVSSQGARIGSDHSARLDSLQSLDRICSCDDCRTFLARIPNLRKLGVEANQISLDGVLMIRDLEFLKCLETLKFTMAWYSTHTQNRTFPSGLKLPPTVKRITLHNVQIKWEELSILQTLPSLEVLKLLDKACEGPVWNTSEEGFSRLKYLKLKHLDIKEWNASEDQFPSLVVLVIEGCENLERIPIDFAKLNELCEINLTACSRSVAISALDIRKEQINEKGDDCFLDIRGTDILLGGEDTVDPRFIVDPDV
ncbi:putative late blight resistance protein homolog R1B-16 isoform X2 [Rhododendron vialii]|uniref:putative late blight resistance protein homolog R1B-16 isoform X2 n=1 Tax=Rhododendron vialii TaxID=182163 RepID=UPI00265F40CD|nr:putative late blight resistance protein homolog R1B-16 isoform X2 [Rhododendron vialii]